MAPDVLRTLLAAVEVLRPAFTAPGFSNLLVVFVGWVRTRGTHAITQTLVETGVAGRRDHTAYHRLFSRGAWSPDFVGALLFRALLKLLPDGAPVRTVVDDTVAAKKGPKVFGLGSHIDAVRSTRKHRIFVFGHCWVVLAVLLPVPFSRRAFALPILLRLYRNKKECLRNRAPYRKKTELAREMIDVLLSWTDRRVEITGDCAYCNDTVLRGLPSRLVLLGAMRPDAVLTALPSVQHKSGRPRVRGEVLPKPEQLARDDKTPWQRVSCVLYGKAQIVEFKTLCAQWYRAGGTRLLRIVVVKVATGNVGLRVFFSTDPRVTVRYLLEGYAARWSIEVCFRELKQLLGFADSSARKRASVERVAPLVAFIYTTLVIWIAQGIYKTEVAAPPVRPWYRHKRGLSFADVLRAAQRALDEYEVLDPVNDSANLHETHSAPRRPSDRGVRLAA